jgi:periplasmic divalent cation tolerance protein
MSALCLVTTTLDSIEKARELARGAVSARYAACVQIDGPIESHYEWHKEIATTQEWRWVAKTLSEHVAELVAYLEANHPYDVPEILWCEVSGVAVPYQKWVRETLERNCDA